MSRGFVILGIDTDVDNVKYAAALSMTIKNCDVDSEVCLVTDVGQVVNQVYYDCFDYITELPFGNTGHDDGFHASNFWQMTHCTPFDETIYLDYDTLFLNVDVDLLWEEFSTYNISMPSLMRTYRNSIANKQSRFSIEHNYEMPTNYSNMCYFNQSDESQAWFKMADPFYQNWREVYEVYFKEKKPESFSKTVINNLVTNALDAEDDVCIRLNNLYDIDAHAQQLWNSDTVTDEWTKIFNNWYTPNDQILIENSLISSGIIHYRDKNFLTDEILNAIRSTFNTRKIRDRTSA